MTVRIPSLSFRTIIHYHLKHNDDNILFRDNMRILPLEKLFRPATSVVYPPFKNGRYLEEYAYEKLVEQAESIQTDLVYVPVFWTNMQIHPSFHDRKQNFQTLLDQALAAMPPTTKYFTIVQHDDGPMLRLPHDTVIFGACFGTIPIPLIYEDVTYRLQQAERTPKTQLASFVGSATYSIRHQMVGAMAQKPNVNCNMGGWTDSVSAANADHFVADTLKSTFCLAPRGYGRSSFRYFEAMLLDTIPVYFWDDMEWLPYKEELDYTKFSVSIQKNEIQNTYEILSSISEEKIKEMQLELKRVKPMFTLDGMVGYVIRKISNQ